MKVIFGAVSAIALTVSVSATAQSTPAPGPICQTAINMCAGGAYRDQGFASSSECYDFFKGDAICPQPGDVGIGPEFDADLELGNSCKDSGCYTTPIGP